MQTKTICFDLDNVICNTKLNHYSKSTPKKDVIKLINKLYSKNHKIIIFTARGMGTYKKNLKFIEKKYRKLTEKQLMNWRVNIHYFASNCKFSFVMYKINSFISCFN